MMLFQIILVFLREWIFAVNQYYNQKKKEHTNYNRVIFLGVGLVSILLLLTLLLLVIFSPTRPSGMSWSSSCDVRVLSLFFPFPCDFFQGLSLALWSHDQFEASHWSAPPLPPPSLLQHHCLICEKAKLFSSNFYFLDAEQKYKVEGTERVRLGK